MPRQKDLKRLVRSRMQKTGESYTASRSHLLKKANKSRSDAELAELAGMSNDAVRAKTDRTWKEWVQVLDSAGAMSMAHRDIAMYVDKEHDIPGWWAQTVTVGYERIRGLREIGQRRGGGYEVNKSKTVPVPLAKLYRAFSTARTRSRWLPGVKLTVRKANAEKSMRITWEDGTPVDAHFYAKGDRKSQVTIQHRGLAKKSDAEKMKKYWSERLAALGEILA